MQNSISASMPGNMPKPRMATSRMVQIISCTEREPMMMSRATGYSNRRDGVMLNEPNHASGIAKAMPSTVAR